MTDAPANATKAETGKRDSGMSWHIVRHAFQMVFGNLAEALKVSVGPVLILVAIYFGMLQILGLPMNFYVVLESRPEMAGAALLAVLVMVVAYLVVFSWVAVAWHRFVLLEEYPGALPAFGGRPVLPYLGKTLLVALILMLIMIPLFMLVGPALGPMMAASPLIGGLLVGLMLGVVFSFFWLRFAVCLPATAVGKPMKIGESWAATAPLSGIIFGVTVIITALNLVASVIAGQLANLSAALGTVVDLGITWVTMMVGVSILTTLYGHLVEGRELA